MGERWSREGWHDAVYPGRIRYVYGGSIKLEAEGVSWEAGGSAFGFVKYGDGGVHETLTRAAEIVEKGADDAR